jgi:hypothetical protein
MNTEELIAALRQRATTPEARSDQDPRWAPKLAPRATRLAIQHAERALGFELSLLHRRLLEEVGNGGFGPGGGLLGVKGGAVDVDGRSLIDVSRQVALGKILPPEIRAVPLCDLGGGAWLYVDAASEFENVLIVDELGVHDTSRRLLELLGAWAVGTEEDFYSGLFEFREISLTNPKTRVRRTHGVRGQPKGRLIHAWGG